MRQVPLFGKYSKDKLLLIDDEDYQRVSQFKWHCTEKGYVVRNEKKKTILIHRFILNAPEDKEVDHRDNNQLNNQKSNLRLCTSQQNKFNSRKQKDNRSGYKGVYLKGDYSRKKPWEAKVYISGKQNHLGYYETKEEAVRVRREFIKTHHGEFVNLD